MSKRLSPPFDEPARLPSAFHCPYAQQCWQREVGRYLLTVLVAFLVSWGTGCAFRVRAPGFDIESKPVYPTTQHQPIPERGDGPGV